jgi:hypothetical protein
VDHGDRLGCFDFRLENTSKATRRYRGSFFENGPAFPFARAKEVISSLRPACCDFPFLGEGLKRPDNSPLEGVKLW